MFKAVAIAVLTSLSLVACAPADTSTQLQTVDAPPPTSVVTTTSSAPTTSTTIPPTTVPPTTVYTAPTLPPPTETIPAPPETVQAPIVEQQVQPSSDIEALICSTFVNDCAKALSVAWCESNYNAGVVGGAGERGLFQIHPVHIPNLDSYGGWDAMFDPSANIAYAYALYSSSGWGPWTCA